jgi:four helix bundle protein
MRPLLRLVAKATVQRIARDILALALAHSGEMKPQFDYEKLNVYQASLEFMTWAAELVSKLDARAAVKDRLDRASTSVPLNIAEGNGKFAIKDRCRFLDFARGSALECAACLDVLVAKRLLPQSSPERSNCSK